MAFSGWPAAAADFYVGLAAANTKEYWAANRPVYNAAVRAPMEELLAELAGEFGSWRIAGYLNSRFRRATEPYKLAIYATLETGGYVKFSAEGLTAGTGYFMMAPDQLDRYRRAAADDLSGGALASVVKDLAAAEINVAGSQVLKSAPRGYSPDHPRIGLLRFKGLIAWRDWPAGPWLSTAEAKTRITVFLRTAAPLQAWLNEHVGPPAFTPGRLLRPFAAIPKVPTPPEGGRMVHMSSSGLAVGRGGGPGRQSQPSC